MKKDLPRHFQHTIPIFDVMVHWVFCEDIIKTFDKSLYMDKVKDRYTSEIDECDGMVVEDGQGHFYIFYDVRQLTLPLVSHEIYHLIRSIYHYLGTKDEEIGARLTEYITQITLELLKKSKIKLQPATKNSMVIDMSKVSSGKVKYE